MYPIFLAVRYARNRIATYLAMLSVTLSVTSFVVVMGVMAGFRREVEQIIQKTAAPIVVSTISVHGIYDSERIAAETRKLPGIRGASPYTQAVSRVTCPRRGCFVDGPLVRGIKLEQELKAGLLNEYLYRDIPAQDHSRAIRVQKPLTELLETIFPGSSPENSAETRPAELLSFKIPKDLPAIKPTDDQEPQPAAFPLNANKNPHEFVIWPERKTVKPSGRDSSKAVNAPRGIIVGVKLAEKLGVKRGDQLDVAVRDPIENGSVRERSFRIIGFYSTRTDWLDGQVIIDLDAARDLLGISGSNGISVWPEKVNTIISLLPQIAKIAGGYEVRSWRETRPEIIEQLEMQDLVMLIILLVFLILCGAFIMAILVVMVTEKTRDIGTIRALGASRMGIVWTFVCQGLALGFAGTVAGLALGMFLAGNINPILVMVDNATASTSFPTNFSLISTGLFGMDSMPVYYSPFHLLAMIVTSLGISLGASLFPAFRAALLNPVEALRHD